MSGLRKGAFYLLAGSAGQSILRVLFSAILARLLSPEDFGLIATANIVTGFAELFVQFGFGQGLVQKKEINKDDVGTAYTSSLLLGLGFGLLLILTSPLIAAFFEQPELAFILQLLSILFPLKSLNQVQFSILQRDMKFKSLAGRDALSYAIGYGVVGIILAYFDYGVMALVYALLVQAVVYSILLGISQREYKMRFSYSKASFHHLFNFGKNLTVSKIFNYLALKGDYFIVSKMMGPAFLGFYSRAYGLMNFPNNMVGNVLNTVLFANYSKYQDDRKVLTNSIHRSFNMLFIVAIPVSMASILLAGEIVQVLLGPGWERTILPFQILSCAISFRIGYKITGTLVKGLGKVLVVARVQFVYFILVILGSYIGSMFGVAHVAAGTSVAVLIMFSMLFHLTTIYTDYSWRDFLVTLLRSLMFGIVIMTLPVILYLTLLEKIELPIIRLMLTTLVIVLCSGLIIRSKVISKKIGAEEVNATLRNMISRRNMK